MQIQMPVSVFAIGALVQEHAGSRTWPRSWSDWAPILHLGHGFPVVDHRVFTGACSYRGSQALRMVSWTVQMPVQPAVKMDAVPGRASSLRQKRRVARPAINTRTRRAGSRAIFPGRCRPRGRPASAADRRIGPLEQQPAGKRLALNAIRLIAPIGKIAIFHGADDMRRRNRVRFRRHGRNFPVLAISAGILAAFSVPFGGLQSQRPRPNVPSSPCPSGSVDHAAQFRLRSGVARQRRHSRCMWMRAALSNRPSRTA